MPQVISSVKALLKHQGRYLVLKETLHKGDVWDLPGGKIEYGESPEEALTREVKEELDVDIEIIRPVGVWYFFSQNSRSQVICHTFLCEPKGEMVIDISHNPADEHFSELLWLTIDEILQSREVMIVDSLRELLSTFCGCTSAKKTTGNYANDIGGHDH
jgi:8-oxo-dGTP diphosphatase